MSLLRQWAFVQSQSLFIHILSSKGSLVTVTILSHSSKYPPALHISELGGWVTVLRVLPGWDMDSVQSLCSWKKLQWLWELYVSLSPAPIVLLKAGISTGTCPFPWWVNRSHLHHPVCILTQEITGSLGLSPSVTQLRASCKYLCLYSLASVNTQVSEARQSKAELCAKKCTS